VLFNFGYFFSLFRYFLAARREVFTLPHVIHVDSSGPLARPDWLVQSPVHWTPTGLQATFGSPVPSESSQSPVESSGIQWSPVSPVHHYSVLYPPPHNPHGLHWTPLDFTIYWTIRHTQHKTGLHWTGLDCQTYSTQNWTPLDLVFKGPVHRTEKKTETGLNRTD
jgi:hypothetical protein